MGKERYFLKMSSYFQRVTPDDSAFEGGEGKAKERTKCSYRDKCDFDVPRGGRLNKNTLQCTRCIKAVLMILNILQYSTVLLSNITTSVNPIANALQTYSIWGILFAFVAQILSILACNYEGFFRIAYIVTEMSLAVNSL